MFAASCVLTSLIRISIQIADGLVGASGGVLRAVGKQSAGALINLTAYYVLVSSLYFIRRTDLTFVAGTSVRHLSLLQEGHGPDRSLARINPGPILRWIVQRRYHPARQLASCR